MAAVISPPAKHELPVHWAVAQPDDTQRRGERGVRLHIDAQCLIIVGKILIGVVALAMFIAAVVLVWKKPPSYYVAIDAVAGLDPETDLSRRATLDPNFNLTLGLASRRTDEGACFEAGTTVAVYYGGVQLAAAGVPRLCAGPRQSAKEGYVVAWGRGVPVPRPVRDGLAVDMWGGGAATFDVTLTVAGYTPGDSWDVLLCSAKVGDPAALVTPCSLYEENVEEPTLQPGYGGYSPEPEAPLEAGDDGTG